MWSIGMLDSHDVRPFDFMALFFWIGFDADPGSWGFRDMSSFRLMREEGEGDTKDIDVFSLEQS
ncbi:MAG: hypothetical protein A4E39_00092 [Methanoregulaceae archaeon PtaB.Bin152]|nr:MAG: hypothetical protein A4E39_00092 [Methanoregulaceae archaeon PtaB.Bin152]